MPYQYIEVDPYCKPNSLLKYSPRGLTPALQHGAWSCYGTTTIIEYLEDLGLGQRLLPPDPKSRADSRVWADHISRDIVPALYRYLQEPDSGKRSTFAEELKAEIDKLVTAASPNGPFFLGSSLSFVDVHVAPWLLRFRRMLKPYRGWPDPEPGSRLAKWITAVEADEYVKATTNDDDAYLESFEKFEGEPNLTYWCANTFVDMRGRKSSRSCPYGRERGLGKRASLSLLCSHQELDVFTCEISLLFPGRASE